MKNSAQQLKLHSLALIRTESKKYSPDQRPLVAQIKTKGKTVRSAQLAEASLGFQIQGGGWFSFCSIIWTSKFRGGSKTPSAPLPLQQHHCSGLWYRHDAVKNFGS